MFYDNLRAVCAEKGTTVTTVLKELHIDVYKRQPHSSKGGCGEYSIIDF